MGSNPTNSFERLMFETGKKHLGINKILFAIEKTNGEIVCNGSGNNSRVFYTLYPNPTLKKAITRITTEFTIPEKAIMIPLLAQQRMRNTALPKKEQACGRQKNIEYVLEKARSIMKELEEEEKSTET